MVAVSSSTLEKTNMTGNGGTTSGTVMDVISGLTAIATRENGTKGECTGKDVSSGLMAMNT